MSHNQFVSGSKTNHLILHIYEKHWDFVFLRWFFLPAYFNKQSLVLYSAWCQIKFMAVWSSTSGQGSPWCCNTAQPTEMQKCYWAIPFARGFNVSAAESSCLFSSSFGADTSNEIMERQSQNSKTTLPLSLGRFHISEDYGFLLPNPLVSMEPLIGSD